MRKIIDLVALTLGYLIIAEMVLLVIAALWPDNGGSLDDLPADVIEKVVNGGTR